MIQASKLQPSALYPVLCVEKPQETSDALQKLFPLEVVFETDWYVHLKSENLQIGFVRFDHESVPREFKSPVRGAFVTIDSDDVKALWDSFNGVLDVVHPLQDEEWGQRHFICKLPGDVLIDVVQMIDQ